MAIITCDVDYTVVNLIPTWWKWLNGITHSNKDINELASHHAIDYNLSVYFEKELEAVNRCGLDFYRQDGLYDTLKPHPTSVDVLRELASAGHEIVFASSIKGRHSKSKTEFLKRNFPFLSGIAYTKEKHYVKSDVFIDDRAEHINQSTAPLKILFNSGMIQYQVLTTDCEVARDWADAEKFILDYLIGKGQ